MPQPARPRHSGDPVLNHRPTRPLIHPERLLHLLGPAPTLPDSPIGKVYQAVMLAPSLPICEALLRNEPVPISALDPVWAKRFGIARRTA